MSERRISSKKLGGFNEKAYLCSINIEIMGKIIDRTITKIVTDEGIALFRRVTKVLMPNGKYRYPVDYFDATPGVVKITKDEMDKVAIPVYQKLI